MANRIKGLFLTFVVPASTDIDLDSVSIEPDEEASDLDAIKIGDLAAADGAPDLGLVVDQVLELDIALAGEVYLQVPALGEGERRHDVREEAIVRKELLNCCAVRRLV
ncbi:hypothetical protein HPP92_010128 [Vanilla planifolia]|uniref:Uncharacterized protein n=1 Tax=Vanilla planifolia TaxID=51239 RepID=A0A835QTA9_VANPL|nr:hypothetical protein HPP92_010128 [Vanilla planifolia]